MQEEDLRGIEDVQHPGHREEIRAESFRSEGAYDVRASQRIANAVVRTRSE
jgi:hypothetical protein